MYSINLNDALTSSKILLREEDYGSLKAFSEYSKGFFLTNENVHAYLEKEKTSTNRALTILGSGDHVFNLISHGFSHIDAMDVNKLEYYVYSLKKAAIETLSLFEFLDFIEMFYRANLSGISRVLEKIRIHLDDEVYEYYRQILEYVKEKGNFSSLYYFSSKDAWKQGNLYLKNEDEYLNLKRKLNEVDIQLFFGDARDLVHDFSLPYDIILLSNILDYFGNSMKSFTLAEYHAFIDQYRRLLSETGVLIISLFWIGAHLDDLNYCLFGGSSIKLSDVGIQNVDVLPHTFGHGYLRVRK